MEEKNKRKTAEYMREYRKTDAYKKYQQKYHQSDAFKKSQQKYHQSDAYKKYHQSDAYKKSQQKYHQSDAFKKDQQKYRQSDAFKKYRQKYHQSKKFNRILPDLKDRYTKQLQETEKELRKYSIPPIALEGKAIMLKEIIDNLDIIRKHADKVDIAIRQRTIEKMVNQLLEKEGILVSRRKQLPIHSPSLKAGVSLGAN